jgi:hypothetical protein
MDNNWHYRKQEGDGGLNRKPPRFKDLGEHSVGIFVREVLQNNVDAAIAGKPLSVEFKINEWAKTEIENFFDVTGHAHIELLKNAAINPDPSIVPFLKENKKIITKKVTQAFSLIVEETNCIGLTGPLRGSNNEKSHFDALMRKVENNEAKKETTNTGGTWGKGSSIFTYTSNLWTWFAYTYLSTPWTDKNNNLVHQKRFMGRCMIAPFYDVAKQESYLGDAWFCDVKKFSAEKIEYPFINDAADDLALKLGLKVRQEPGTTFFIPFFNPVYENENKKSDINQITEEFIVQILKSWYIPIFNNVLTVKVSNNTNLTVIDKDYLKKVPELRFKLELLEWYNNDCPPNKLFHNGVIEIEVPALNNDFILSDNRLKFAKDRQKVKSDMIIRILSDDEDFNDNWNTINKAALCRNKGMIVNNEILTESKAIRAEIILLTGLMAKHELSLEKQQHSDLFFAYSENPAHNIWCRKLEDYSQCFLERFEGKRPKPEASINALFNEAHRILKKLIEEDNEQRDNKDICSIFKKLARLKSTGEDAGRTSLFSLRKIADEINGDGKYVFTRKLISNSIESSIEVNFKTYIDSLEGEWDKNFDLLGIPEFNNLTIFDENDIPLSQGQNPKINIAANEVKIIKIQTCAIDMNPSFKNIEPIIKVSAKTI